MKVRILYLVLGILFGAFLFTDTRARTVFDIRQCTNCMHPNEITGLVVAAGLPYAQGWFPLVELETDHAIIIRHPLTKGRHFVGFPKRDVKNVGELEAGDMPYLTGLFEGLSSLIGKYKMTSYKVWSNGPEQQSVGYLHFHLAEQ